MLTSTPVFTLVSALAGAGAYAHEQPADAGASDHAAQVVAHILHARVEIYCGHNAAAIAGIRTAREQLQASAGAVPVESLAALDQAAWLTRHDHYALAELALEAALNHLPPTFKRA
jgi:hypothetical protein